MTTAVVTLLCIICIIFNGCTGVVQSQDTAQVEEYISKFGLSIEDATDHGKVYLFIPRNQCKNCMRLKINSELDIADDLVLFSGFPADNFTGFKNYYFDSSNTMFGIKCLDYGNRFVLIKNANVDAVIPVTDIAEQIDSLNRALY